MPQLKTYNGSSWDTAIAKVYDGSSWKEQMKFYNGTAWVELYPTLAVSPVGTNVTNTRVLQTCYAGVQYNTNGIDYASSNVGGWTNSRGNWLDAGSNNDVWVERTINSGTLNWQDPGSGRYQLNFSRSFGVSQSVVGIKTCNLTVNFYDAASGGNLLGSATYTVTAEYVDLL